MPDIVDRLKDRDSIVIAGLFHAIPTMREAADEIERLRGLVTQLRAEITASDEPGGSLAAWRDVPVTMPFLADLFDAFCGADGHNLVVQQAANAAKQNL